MSFVFDYSILLRDREITYSFKGVKECSDGFRYSFKTKDGKENYIHEVTIPHLVIAEYPNDDIYRVLDSLAYILSSTVRHFLPRMSEEAENELMQKEFHYGIDKRISYTDDGVIITITHDKPYKKLPYRKLKLQLVHTSIEDVISKLKL